MQTALLLIGMKEVEVEDEGLEKVEVSKKRRRGKEEGGEGQDEEGEEENKRKEKGKEDEGAFAISAQVFLPSSLFPDTRGDKNMSYSSSSHRPSLLLLPFAVFVVCLWAYATRLVPPPLPGA